MHDNFHQVCAAVRRPHLYGGDNGHVRKRVLQDVLQGTRDANVRFEELRSLLSALAFEERIRGDHHIFSREGVSEILNLQPRGSLAKAYQVKQVRCVIVRYKLAEGVE
jgi:hypothetical protein